ncbi:hypothetical protein, partial [Mesorhizobium sp. M7A.F.Ca.MR.362.00.0.0]|uniref:hypothetical protein n=1 Tax=Mesorhizobium sp. M7A.F.Ca.MR.362.00.0.0 TaxID=2496779 RepID=UPI000FD5EE7F
MKLNSLEKGIGIEKEFSISEWLAETVSTKGLKHVVRINDYTRNRSFKDICTKVRNQLQEIVIDGSIDKKSSNEVADAVEDDSNVWLERQHRAVIGDQQAMSYFITKINEVLH